MNENLVESMKNLEQIFGYAEGIVGCIRNNLFSGLISQREYKILKDFYDKLFLKAIELGEEKEWITLPERVEDAVFHLNYQYN